MTTTPAASMVIPILSITSLKAISLPVDLGLGGSVRVEDGKLLERALPEVAHIVDMVTLQQRRDAGTVGRARRNMQDQLTLPQRLVVDLKGLLVVTQPLKGPHDPAAQPVVAAMLIQDARSLLPAQDLHRRDVHPGGLELACDGGDLRLLGQQAYHAVGRPVIEVVNVDLGLVHIAAPSRGIPGTILNSTGALFCNSAPANCHRPTS